MQATDTLEHFYQTARKLVEQPASGRVPAGSRFHPSAVPSIVVHAGPIDRLPQLRRELPDHTFLLGLCDPAEAQTAPDCAGRTGLQPITDVATCVGALQLLSGLYPNQVAELIAVPDFRSRHAEECRAVEEAVVSVRENAESQRQRGLIRLRCGCAHLQQMLSGGTLRAAAVPAELPVVLCGAGPSLSRNLETLRSVKDRVVVAAVGHAVNALCRAGVVPNLIFECDSLAGQNWPDDLCPDSVLVAGIDVDPAVPARFERVCWMAGSSLPMNEIMEHYRYPLGKVSLGKTISVQAIDFLQRMGFRRIALVGQDYCLTADGQVHAGESGGTGPDHLHQVPGALGGTVTTNETLKSLLAGMNGYLPTIASKPGMQLINLSGGAALEATAAVEFKVWAAALEHTEIPPLFSPLNAELNPELLHRTIDEVRAAAEHQNGVLKACRALRNEFGRHPLRMNRVRTAQQKLEAAIAAEAGFRSDAVCANLLHTLFVHADEIMNKTPGLVSDQQDPEVQLNYLSRRYGFVKRLCADVLGCLEQGSDPCVFETFRAENLHAVKRMNPAFAARLAQTAAADLSEYKFHWINQLVPYVRRRVEDEWKPLSANTSIYLEAAEVVVRFMAEEGFNPARDALTIVAPGNWVYVLEFARRCPGLKLAVIEPWPDLLGSMLDRGCFLNQLPADCTLVQTWADPVYMKCRGEWNARGLRQKLFISPHVRDMEDVAVLARNLEVLP